MAPKTNGTYESTVARDRELREAITIATEARLRIATAPEPIDVVVDNMRVQVDEYAEAWVDKSRAGILEAFSGALESTPDGTMRVNRPRMFRLPDFGRLTFNDLVGLAPEVIKMRLEEILRAVHYEAGPPLAERPPLIAEIDARLVALESEHEALVDDAGALDPPIALDHLPTVRQRREAAASRALHDAETNATYQKAESEVDAAYVPRSRAITLPGSEGVSRSARSPYIDGAGSRLRGLDS